VGFLLSRPRSFFVAWGPGAGLEPRVGKFPPEACKGNAEEVGLYNNRFEPPLLIVSAGTAVRWMNHRQHTHTVTSDRGRWASEGLSHEGVYSYTFPNPGT
jgi:plastocyanin